MFDCAMLGKCAKFCLEDLDDKKTGVFPGSVDFQKRLSMQAHIFVSILEFCQADMNNNQTVH